MDPQPGPVIGGKGLHHHARPEIRSPDADIDHITDRFSGKPAPAPGMHLFDKASHLRQDSIDRRHDILPLNQDGTPGTIAQRNMKGRPLLRTIDRRPRKHATDFFFKIALSGKIAQKPEGLSGNAIFGIVEQQIFELEGEIPESFGILREQIAHVHFGYLLMMFLQLLPCLRLGQHLASCVNTRFRDTRIGESEFPAMRNRQRATASPLNIR